MPRDWPPGPVWVVLPTYNERENLEPRRGRRARGARPRAAPDHTVLVVDDSSPDGTGELADRLAARRPARAVLHRPRKEGLGQAYVAGFRRALAQGAALVIEMDADFSHDPAHLPAMIDAARQRRPRARLALRAGRRGAQLGRDAAAGEPRRLLVRPHRAGRSACAT